MKKKRIRRSTSDRVFIGGCTAVLGFAAFVVLIPMMNIVASSFSDPTAVSTGKVWIWPVEFTLLSYENVLKYEAVWLGYRNTIFYTVFGTVMNVAITLLCAYPLAQKTFAGRKFVSKMLTITMIFGGGMIPNYLLVKELNMLNSIWAVLIPSLMSATNVIIVRNYIETNLSGELEEAARVDGCSPIKYFTQFVLPLSKSIIAVVTMYYAVSHWNSYFSAFLYLNDRELFPLQLFLRDILVNSQFDNSIVDDPEMAEVVQSAADALKYSIIVISTAPLMLAYPLVQKHFVKGIMVGSVKG